MRDEAKIFKTVAKNGGQIARAELSTRVFGRNKSAAELDALLKAPMLIGLLVESRAKVRKGGRVSIRYTLTPAGWKIARAWQLPTKTERIAPEETLRQFQTLVADGHPFASALSQDAAAWRTHQEEERRKREEKAAAAKEKRRERELTHPPVKYPSKGRNRSPEDLAKREMWLASKKAEQAQTPNMDAFKPYQPRSIFAPPPQKLLFGIGPDSTTRQIVAQSNDDAELLEKIRIAGYQTRKDTNEVMYAQRWISIAAWMEKMPGIIA